MFALARDAPACLSLITDYRLPATNHWKGIHYEAFRKIQEMDRSPEGAVGEAAYASYRGAAHGNRRCLPSHRFSLGAPPSASQKEQSPLDETGLRAHEYSRDAVIFS
jgi:hypothetical protein